MAFKQRFYKTKKNSGPGIARNIGLAKANGKKILFLDADDSLLIKNLKYDTRLKLY